MAILQVHPVAGQPAPADLVTASSPVGATLVSADPQHLVIETTSEGSVLATVAVAWSPKWRVTVDGTPVPAAPSEDKLVQVALPAGSATVTLDHAIDGADIVGRAVTALSLGVAIVALVLSRRRRDRGPADPV
jgi:hypothetical protein